MMTIGAWVLLIFLAILGITIAASIFFGVTKEVAEKYRAYCCIGAAAVLAVTLALCGVVYWYNTNSASGRRALKDQEANLNGGLHRVVTVYDINGNIIKQYEGTFDVETDNQSYILFDDDNNLRHIIYYTTGTITVDEVRDGN